MIIKRLLAVTGILALAVAGLTLSSAAPVDAGGGAGPVVIELFTSQSCFSCPPAEAHLGELLKKKNVIGLEFHVDYWDELIYGRAGKWKDVFSSPAHTKRQRGYAVSVPGARVYTPQMVIGGRVQAVGSRRFAVKSAIRSVVKKQKSGHLDVTLKPRAGGGFRVSVSGPVQRPASVWLIGYKRAVTTRVRAGENRGKSLTNHNIVQSVARIGAWRGAAVEFDLPGLILGGNDGCAVLVQVDGLGPILGAAVCPDPAANS